MPEFVVVGTGLLDRRIWRGYALGVWRS